MVASSSICMIWLVTTLDSEQYFQFVNFYPNHKYVYFRTTVDTSQKQYKSQHWNVTDTICLDYLIRGLFESL